MKNENPLSQLNRREFIRNSSFATLMAMSGGIELKAESPAPAKASEPGNLPSFPCAVIGCGAWGRDILRNLARLPNTPVQILCDSAERPLNRAANTAPDAKKTKDFREALK